MAAISLSIKSDPKAIGELRIAAGDDPKEVSRWVMIAEMENREKDVHNKIGGAHGA